MPERKHVSVRLHAAAVERIGELAAAEGRVFSEMLRVLIADGLAMRTAVKAGKVRIRHVELGPPEPPSWVPVPEMDLAAEWAAAVSAPLGASSFDPDVEGIA